MLKKITIVSAVALLAALVGFLTVLPAAVKDCVRESERIVGEFYQSTPVSTFDGTHYAAVNIDMGDAHIFVEQSPDDGIYIKAEGIFAGRFSLVAASRAEGEQNILDVRLDTDKLFFDAQHAPYLLLRGLYESSASAVVLRVPEGVAVTTENSPWLVDYPDGARFANRAYYDDREWNRDREAEERARALRREAAGRLMDRYSAQFSAFTAELDTWLVTAEADGADDVEIRDEIDIIANAHYERMCGQLFPYDSEIYDAETLSTLLRNCVTLTAQSYKAQTEEGEGQERFYAMQESALRARESFEEVYRNYIDRAAAAAGEDEPPTPAEAPGAPGESPVPAEPGAAETPNAPQDETAA